MPNIFVNYSMINLQKSGRGFTLLELVLVVGLMAILAAVAVPAWHSWKANSDLKSAIYQISGVIQWARSEAAKQNLCMGMAVTVTGNVAIPGGAITVFRDDGCDATKRWGSALQEANDQCGANTASTSSDRCLRRLSFTNTASLFATQDAAFSINPRGLVRNGPSTPFSISLGNTYNSNGYQLMISPALAVRIDSNNTNKK